MAPPGAVEQRQCRLNGCDDQRELRWAAWRECAVKTTRACTTHPRRLRAGLKNAHRLDPRRARRLQRAAAQVLAVFTRTRHPAARHRSSHRHTASPAPSQRPRHARRASCYPLPDCVRVKSRPGPARPPAPRLTRHYFTTSSFGRLRFSGGLPSPPLAGASRPADSCGGGSPSPSENTMPSPVSRA